MQLFLLSSLTTTQTIRLGSLLRQRPYGRVESHGGEPVFISDEQMPCVVVYLSRSCVIADGGIAP
jgi:hypothetical protein